MEIQNIINLMTPAYREERARLSEESRKLALIAAARQQLQASIEASFETPLDNNLRTKTIGSTATNAEALVNQR